MPDEATFTLRDLGGVRDEWVERDVIDDQEDEFADA